MDLGNLKDLVKSVGSENLVFDPSLCPDTHFYTGIYFNLLIEGIGDVVGIGGRYDNLYKSFDKDFSAIGFAYYMAPFLKALQEQNLLK